MDQNELLALLRYDLAKHGDFASNRLSERYLKKFISNSNLADNAAVLKFRTINAFVGNQPECSLSPIVLGEARQFIYDALFQYTYKTTGSPRVLNEHLLMTHWRYSSGAACGTRSKHPAEKILGHPTATKRCRDVLTALMAAHPRLGSLERLNATVVRGSKLFTVPKNNEISRTCAKEPTENMALQLSAGSYLVGALRCKGLHIDSVFHNSDNAFGDADPSDLEKLSAIKNRRMAQQGSIDGTLSTIDMESASDLIRPSLVRALMPPEWYYLLNAIRSEEIHIKSVGWVKMNIFSSMGNGFTFALMTLLFAGILY